MDITDYINFKTEVDPDRIYDVEQRIRLLLREQWPDLATTPSSVFGNLFITPAARVVAMFEQAADCVLSDLNLENALNSIVCDCDFIEAFLKGLGINSLYDVNVTSMVRVTFTEFPNTYNNIEKNALMFDQGYSLLFNSQYIFHFIQGFGHSIVIQKPGKGVKSSPLKNIYTASVNGLSYDNTQTKANSWFADLPVYGPATASIDVNSEAAVDASFPNLSKIVSIQMLEDISPLELPTTIKELAELCLKIQPSANITTKYGAISYIYRKFPRTVGTSVVTALDFPEMRRNVENNFRVNLPFVDIYTKGVITPAQCTEFICANINMNTDDEAEDKKDEEEEGEEDKKLTEEEKSVKAREVVKADEVKKAEEEEAKKENEAVKKDDENARYKSHVMALQHTPLMFRSIYPLTSNGSIAADEGIAGVKPGIMDSDTAEAENQDANHYVYCPSTDTTMVYGGTQICVLADETNTRFFSAMVEIDDDIPLITLTEIIDPPEDLKPMSNLISTTSGSCYRVHIAYDTDDGSPIAKLTPVPELMTSGAPTPTEPLYRFVDLPKNNQTNGGQWYAVTYDYDPLSEAIKKTIQGPSCSPILNMLVRPFFTCYVSEINITYRKNPGMFFDRQAALDSVYNFINGITYPVTYDPAYITDILLTGGASSVIGITAKTTFLATPAQYNKDTNEAIRYESDSLTPPDISASIVDVYGVGPKNVMYICDRDNINLIEQAPLA